MTPTLAFTLPPFSNFFRAPPPPPAGTSRGPLPEPRPPVGLAARQVAMAATPLGPDAVSALSDGGPDALPSADHPTSVLVVSDKAAKDDAAAWGSALADALAGHPVNVVPVVDAAHLPGPLVPFVSVYLKAIGATEAVVDKKGWTEKEEGYKPGTVLLMVVGRGSGTQLSVLWRRSVAGVDDGVLDQLISATK